MCSLCNHNTIGQRAISSLGCLLMGLFLARSLSAGEPATNGSFDPEPIVGLFELLIQNPNGDIETAKKCLAILAEKIRNRELSPQQVALFKPRLDTMLGKIMDTPRHPLREDAAFLATSWKNPVAAKFVRGILESTDESEERRLLSLQSLLAVGDDGALEAVNGVLSRPRDSSAAFRGKILNALGRAENDGVAKIVLSHYDQLEAELQPKAVELLTQRVVWSKALLNAIGDRRIPASTLNVNQVAALQVSKDADLVKLVTAKWGAVRTQRNPQREEVVAQMKELLRKTPGNAAQGQQVFQRVCAQCHKIHGQGNDVGPDLTANGRNDFNQLVSNVFDPSLVIGAAYQARTIRTTDGRILTGLPQEESDQRVVLKMQGGKVEVVPRDEIEQMKTSELSLMPEGLEKQLKPDEILDLFAFLSLDKPPGDPGAKRLSDGTKESGPSK